MNAPLLNGFVTLSIGLLKTKRHVSDYNIFALELPPRRATAILLACRINLVS